MVRIRTRSKKVMKTNKKTLGKSIEEHPESINDRSVFGYWEVDMVLGKKTKGEVVILTLVERQTRYTVGVKLEDKQSHKINEHPRRLLQYQSSKFLFGLVQTA